MTLAPWRHALADVVDPPEGQHPELATPVTLAAYLDPHGYRVRPHLEVIGRELADLEAGAFDRLLLNTPPQVGKSMTAVEWGSFWWLCKHPETRIVIGSYSDDLAERRGRNIRRLVERYGHLYKLLIEQGNRRVRDWSLTSGGGIRSVGAGSGITGFPAELMFIDDPIASWEAANSLTKRDHIYDWYTAAMLTRLAPSAPLVMIHTPWHVDDLRARVLQQEGDRASGGGWRVVVMPALCTDPENDPLGRAEGGPISHPDPKLASGDTQALLRWWLQVRAKQPVRVWQALYQCDPKPQEGALLSWQLLRDRRCFEAGWPLCSEPRIVAVTVDPSGGGRDTAGVLGCYLGVDDRLYFTHDRSGVMPSDQWGRAACELAADIGADRIIVERNYGGDMAILVIRTAWEALRREQPDRFGALVPRIVEVVARRAKLLRAEPIAQQWIEGRCWTAAYLPDLESEWATWQQGMDSPGRIDASVHAGWSLLPIPGSGESSTVGAAILAETNLLGWR